MVTIRAHDSDSKSRVRHRLVKATSLALGLAMFGTVGLSGTLAQDDNVATGGDTESIVNAIIAQVFADIFGGEAPADDAADVGGGDLNMGGSRGGSVTMGGSGGSVNMGGSGGGITVGDDTGG